MKKCATGAQTHAQEISLRKGDLITLKVPVELFNNEGIGWTLDAIYTTRVEPTDDEIVVQGIKEWLAAGEPSMLALKFEKLEQNDDHLAVEFQNANRLDQEKIAVNLLFPLGTNVSQYLPELIIPGGPRSFEAHAFLRNLASGDGEETAAKSTIDVLQPPQSIEGFSDIPWGSPLTVVEEKLGKPEESMEIGNGAIAVGYKETILHEDVHTILVLSQKSGLMKGMYSIGFGRGNDCVSVYEKFRDAVARAYPNLTQRENRPNSTVSLGFCDAVRIGEAFRYTIWEDEGNDAYSVGVTLLPGEDRVRVRYESPMFLRWQKDWEQEEIRSDKVIPKDTMQQARGPGWS